METFEANATLREDGFSTIRGPVPVPAAVKRRKPDRAEDFSVRAESIARAAHTADDAEIRYRKGFADAC